MSGWANHIEPTSGTRLDYNMVPGIKESILKMMPKIL
jgi:hypothetical protein